MYRNIVVNGELLLYGDVGDLWYDDCFTAVDVINALASMPGDVTVRLNSGGGIADEGIAIYNALSNHKGKVTIYIDGVAASAASIIAMAGAETIMRAGTYMMIHDPQVYADGDAEEMRKTVDYLNTLGDSMASIYAKASGKEAKACRAEMKSELWLTAEQAVEQGYADRTDGETASEAVAFDYRTYAKAPETLRALAATKGWQKPSRKAAASTAPTPTPTKDKPMPFEQKDIDKAVADAVELATAITNLCTTKGVPAMAAALLKEKVTLEQATARVEQASSIREIVAQANKSCKQIDLGLADVYIAAGATAEKVRADMFDKMAAVQEATPTYTQHSGDGGPKGQDAIAKSWSEAVAKVNKQFGFTPRA